MHPYKVKVKPVGYFVKTDIAEPGFMLPTFVIFSSLSGDIGGYFHLLQHLGRDTSASIYSRGSGRRNQY